MKYITKRFARSNQEIYNDILKIAKEKGVDIKTLDKMPEGAAAFYMPKKGVGGSLYQFHVQ